MVAAVGARASYRFLEFFTAQIAQIRNPHTRRAYARAVTEFFDWLEAKGITQIAAIESVHVATYIEQLQRARSAPTAKLRLGSGRLQWAEEEREGLGPVSRSWGSSPCETGAFAMPDKPISPLRQRMIGDMTARRFKEKVQKDYVRHVRTFAAFVGRSPDTATKEDLRRFQVHIAQQQIGVPTINAAIAALRFFFNVTLERPDLVRRDLGVRL